MEELTKKQEDFVSEQGREQMKITCDFCKEEFDEEDMDLCLIDEGETVWLCRSCEENHKKGCEEK